MAYSDAPAPGGHGEREAAPGVEESEPAGPVGVDDPSFFQHLPQFVLFPLIVVVVAVLIIVFFKASVEERVPVSQLLDQIESGWWKRKDQPAFALAMRAGEIAAEGGRFSARDTEHLIRIIGDASEPVLRTSLVQALGLAGEESLALAELLRAIERPRQDPLERIAVVTGLGLSLSPGAVEPLAREYGDAAGDEQWEIRLHALMALANIVPAIDRAEPAAVETARSAFRAAIEDPKWTVSWNAAATLATVFHDASGRRTLLRMLDREELGRFVEPGHQDLWIERAIEALTELDDEEARPTIDALEQDRDSGAAVRNAIFKYRKRMDAKRAA